MPKKLDGHRSSAFKAAADVEAGRAGQVGAADEAVVRAVDLGEADLAVEAAMHHRPSLPGGS